MAYLFPALSFAGAAVYESIQMADTVGLFQIESRAQMSALPRTKPKCFADLSMQDEHELETSTPLLPMTTEERLVADFGGTGLTIGPHLMSYHRADMNRAGVTPAADLRRKPDGIYARIAGVVIARQRPGTASGFVFLGLEDETGISNAIINPHLYERNRVAVTRGKILRVEGTLQNQDGVISVKASAVRVLDLSHADVRSHDFH